MSLSSSSFAALGCAAALALSPALDAQRVSSRVRSLLPVDGQIVSIEVADVDGDGLGDLFVIVRAEGGPRELRVYRLRRDGAFPAEPDYVLEIKKDVVTWSLGEFLPDQPGVELLLTTRSGAFALSPRQSSYRGLVKMSSAPMLLDLAAQHDLPYWPGVADIDGDGVDEIALVTWDGFAVFDVGGNQLAEVPFPRNRMPRLAVDRVFKLAPFRVTGEPLSDLLVPDDDPGILDPPPAVYADEELPLPFFADADGDGLQDLIYTSRGELFVHRQRAEADESGHRFPLDPDATHPFGIGTDWKIQDLRFEDLGGSPAADIMLTRSADEDSVVFDWEILLFQDALARPGGLNRPITVVTSEATLAGAYLGSLDPGSGRDLFVSSWNLELNALGLQGVDIRHVVAAYPAEEGGGHASTALFRYERSYSADDFTAFSRVPSVSADLDGDGRTDLVESDPTGSLEIRALRMRGSRPGFVASPTATIEVDALSSPVLIRDLDGDGIGDLLVLRETVIEAYVARKR